MSTRICLSLMLCLAMASWAVGQLPPKASLAGKAADFSQARSLPYQSNGRTIFENVIVNNQHLVMVVDWKNGKLEPLEVYPLTTAEIPDWNGSWEGITPVVTDPTGDATPEGPSGTDFSALYMARDQSYMYFRLALDNYPADRCTYTVEFRQYLNQVNTPGDLASETIRQQKPDGSWIWNTMVWGSTGTVSAQSYQLWDDPHVQAGNNYIQWRVPINSLHFSDNAPWPLSPPHPLGPQGIENRFITVTIWGVPDSAAPGLRDNGPVAPDLPMIVNFEPPQ